jgi:hypothetical protein
MSDTQIEEDHVLAEGPRAVRPTAPSIDQTGFSAVEGAFKDRRLLPPGSDVSIAVLLPCLNEEATIGKVVRDFRSALPEATVFVYDNASTDRTAQEALAAGAIVRYSPVPGKGNVLRSMFADVDASVYVLADGDDTYDARAAPEMIKLLRENRLDMVVGKRVASEEVHGAYRRGHVMGNRLLSRAVHWTFGDGSADMLSGYRVFSRQYIKSFPALSLGFETETEMTVHALELCLPFQELPTEYRERPSESISKLRTIPDGLCILKMILLLCKDYRPLRFFGAIGFASGLAAIAVGLMAHGRLHAWTPATFLLAGFCALAVGCAFVAVILDSLRRSQREIKRSLYLATPAARDLGHGDRLSPALASSNQVSGHASGTQSKQSHYTGPERRRVQRLPHESRRS